MRELNSQGPIRKTNTTYLCSDRAMARAAQLVAMATPRCRARAPCPASPAKKSTRGPHLLPIPSPLLPLLSPFFSPHGPPWPSPPQSSSPLFEALPSQSTGTTHSASVPSTSSPPESSRGSLNRRRRSVPLRTPSLPPVRRRGKIRRRRPPSAVPDPSNDLRVSFPLRSMPPLYSYCFPRRVARWNLVAVRRSRCVLARPAVKTA